SLVERQEVLAGAWSEFIRGEIDDQEEFVEAWEQLRALRLEEAGFNPVWR
ncbi:MAG: C4-dicarboxylate ABC transporter substrate-binding protein, partial [Gammaproteobacteria bacterium]|nr:C4-dicarboxylate ABC transporter substrate-binding protein [Gammaproteobacteria bacterium]